MKPRKEDRGRQNWLLIKKRDEFAGEGDEPTLDLRHEREERPHHGPDPARRLGRVELQQGSKKNSKRRARRPTAKKWHGKAPPQARRAKAPEFIEPELATLVSEVPTGRVWLHEAKYDGYRIVARKSGDEIYPVQPERARLDGTLSADRQGACRAFPRRAR